MADDEEKRPEWMTSISSTVNPEDYLLGRKIDETFELSQKEKADKAREARIDLIAKDKIKLTHDPILDLERRKKQLKMDLIQNPVMLKQFRDKLLRGELDNNNRAGPSRSNSGPVSIKKGKVQIHGAKPEMPAFLQRIKEQIVANEHIERRARSERHRSNRAKDPSRQDDDPTIVQLNADDLTEAEYKRMKTELETQYKIPSGDVSQRKAPREELDIDQVMKSRSSAYDHESRRDTGTRRDNRSSRDSPRSSRDRDHHHHRNRRDELDRHKTDESDRHGRDGSDRHRKEESDRHRRNDPDRHRRDEPDRHRRDEPDRHRRDHSNRQKREGSDSGKGDGADRRKRDDSDVQKRSELDRHKSSKSRHKALSYGSSDESD